MNDTTANASPEVTELLSRYREGLSLPADFYRSQAVYRADLEGIFNRGWIYAGHVSQLAEAGDYFLLEFGDESVIVVRDQAGAINAFANVCRHRGSRICLEPSGRAKVFICPYHAWTYELDGRLRSRRAMGDDFDTSRYGLKPVGVAAFHGLVFVNLEPDAPDLVEALQPMDASFAVYDLAEARVAQQRTYRVDANWKLAVENFMECYHCAPAHSEYSRIHALKSPRDNARLRPAMLARAAELGYGVESFDNSKPANRGEVQYYYQRNALYEPALTGTSDGAPVAPLLGRVKDYDGGAADFQIGPVSFGIIYGDHAVLYRFLPVGVQKTDMEIVWLVRAGAQEGVDYDLDRLTWMWDVTTEADKTIILSNQRGVNSRFYEPGPLSEMETFTTGFIKWYLAQIG